MIHLPLPSFLFGDRSLYLSFPWGHWPLGLRLFLFLLCVSVPVGLVVWLYRYETRIVRGRAAAALLSLRLGALALLLILGLLQPIIVRHTQEQLPGRVVVALDRSDSMDVTDPQRPAVEKLRLARAFNLAEDICPKEQLDAWITQYETGGTFQPVGPDELLDDLTKRRTVAEERRKLHDQVCKRADDLPRLEIARRALEGNLLKTIGERHKVELSGFTQDAWDLKPEQAGELFGKRPTTAQGTDLRLPLARALERNGPDQGKILGVVLVTDGQHNWGQPPVAKARELGEHGLPVYPIALGAKQGPPAIAVAAVKAPPAVFKDVDVGVEARVHISGLPAGEFIVELQRPGQPPLTETIRHDGNDRFYQVAFNLRLEQVGTQTLTVTAKQNPAEVQPGLPVRTENSSRVATINVADDKAKVLLIDGEARWEFHYLSSALARDRTMQVNRVVFEQPRLGKISEEELRKLGSAALTMPTEPDALAGFDCIVLGDVTPAQLPLSERVRLEKYVADRGGTLVILAGKRAMPSGYLNGMAVVTGASDVDPLLRLLPIMNPRPFNSTRGFHVALTDEGQRLSFLQMDATADKSQQRWAGLPPHYWAVIGEPKPGAVVLASLTEQDSRPTRLQLGDPVLAPRDADPAGKRGLIVRQNYGFGRVLYVGLDSTWRWRFKTGDKYHHRFWGQVVRWAASDKPLVTGNETVRFGTREPVYTQGQDVELVARLGENVPPLRSGSLAGARIVRAEETSSESAAALVPLVAPAAQPRLLEGRVRDLPPGKYFVELAIPELEGQLTGPVGSDGRPGKLRAPFTVAPRDNGEMIELAMNLPLLEDIAAKSGGKVYFPETAGELADVLKRQVVTRDGVSERKLWQDWWTLGLFLVLLTAEWVARKAVGLP